MSSTNNDQELPKPISTSDHLDADDAAKLLLSTGVSKAYQRIDHAIVRNFIGGALVSVGGMLTLLVKGGCNGLEESNPAIVQILLGLVFPVGLAMSTLTGGELSTGNVLFLVIALLQRKIPIWRAVTCFTVSFLGNLAGSLFYLIISHFGHILSAEPYRAGTIIFANDKVLVPSGITVFVRAIGCNWLICIGVYNAFLSRTVVSRVISIWIPIFTFVAVGFENSVANMFLVPMGMINGSPISVGLFIWKSLILSTLGNMVGGGFFVGALYWYLYIFPEVHARDEIDGGHEDDIIPIAETASALAPILSRALTQMRSREAADSMDILERQDRERKMQSLSHDVISESPSDASNSGTMGVRGEKLK
ncbi:Formate/nitrite transporter-domain-containing protein [Lipomyces arxii]|uniref:Formate/nitrite transporter-domain-containing protein n=1 Tax=Lipomyces arxii TaxID=56418 RepID=UPI0034CE96AA